MNPLLDQLRTDALWLFEDRGFKVIGESYEPKAFGNCVVVLQSGQIKIRFSSDRGQIFAELESLVAPKEWWDVIFLLEAIRGTIPQPTFDLQEVGSLLRENFTDLIESLGPNWAQTRQVLQRRRQERLEALRTGGKN